MKTFVSILALFGALLLVLHRVQNAGADVLTRRGHEAYGSGDYALAIDLYSKAIAEGPRADGLVALDEVYASRGRAYLKSGDFRAAKADLSEALERKPDATRYFDRSVARQELGDVAGALTDLRSAIALDARHAEAHRKLCPLLVEREGSEAALPTCLHAAKLGQPVAGAVKTELEAALCRLAEADYSSGNHDRFLSRHRELGALSPDAAPDTFSKARLANSHYHLGEGLLRNGSPDAAVEHYKAAIDLDPRDLYRRRAVTALFTAGESSEAEENYGSAVDYYELALDLAGSQRGEVEARLAFARRMEHCHSLKSSGDSAIQRINWTLVERANEILAPYNRGIEPTPGQTFYIFTNSEELAGSVMALLEANEAYRDLMRADCPSRVVDDALRSNFDLILSWAAKADALTQFLVDKMKEKQRR